MRCSERLDFGQLCELIGAKEERLGTLIEPVRPTAASRRRRVFVVTEALPRARLSAVETYANESGAGLVRTSRSPP